MTRPTVTRSDWRLPFMIYLLPFVPLLFAKGFGKYITDPNKVRQCDAAKNNVPKMHYKFSKEVNIGMLVRYCAFYFFITLVIAAISLYIPFLFKNSSIAGDLTSVLFFGIRASGYTLNWCLRRLKNWVAVTVIIAVAVGFLLIVVAPISIWIVGLGILIATYFYGIAQPAYYNRLSQASSRIALTLTLAWFASMDSIGNVVAPFVIDGIAKVFGESTQTHPVVAFQICMWIAFAATAIVVIRKIVVTARAKELEHKAEELKPATASASASEVTKATLPQETVSSKVSQDSNK